MPLRPLLERASRWITAGGLGTLVVIVVAALANLAGAVATKFSCPAPSARDIGRAHCYSDLRLLWVRRHLGQHLFPYVHGTYVVHGYLMTIAHGEIEYPVVIGLFAWAAGLLAHSATGFLALNAVGLTVVGAVAGYLLYRLAGWRVLLFAASPAVAFYAFLNWDLLAVACAAGVAWCWYRRHPCWALALAGVGAFTKIWPAFLGLAILAELVYEHRWRTAAGAAAAGGGAALALNLPFVLVNFRGWYAPYLFQEKELLSTGANGIWSWFVPWALPPALDTFVFALFCMGALMILVVVLRRARAGEPFPVLQMAAALTCCYMVTAKVISPQYDLWVLLFLVVLGTPWWLLMAFTLSSIWVFIVWFGYPVGGVLLEIPDLVRLAVLVGAGCYWLVWATPRLTGPPEAPAGALAVLPLQNT